MNKGSGTSSDGNVLLQRSEVVVSLSTLDEVGVPLADPFSDVEDLPVSCARDVRQVGFQRHIPGPVSEVFEILSNWSWTFEWFLHHFDNAWTFNSSHLCAQLSPTSLVAGHDLVFQSSYVLHFLERPFIKVPVAVSVKVPNTDCFAIWKASEISSIR